MSDSFASARSRPSAARLLILSGLLLPAVFSDAAMAKARDGAPALRDLEALRQASVSWVEIKLPTFQGPRAFRVARPDDRASHAARVMPHRAKADGGPLDAGWMIESNVLLQLSDAAAADLIDAGWALESIDGVPGFRVLRAASIRAAAAAARRLADQPGVELAYVDIVPPQNDRALPTDPSFADQWHLQNLITPIADANVAPAWNLGFTGAGVVVGVIDGGALVTHPDLAPNYSSALSTSTVASSHGTSVAGVIAAQNNNGLGGVGVAYDATWSNHVYGSATTTAGSLGAFNASHVIKNNSWGPADNARISFLDPAVRTALQTAATTGRGGRGVLFTWAAGNGGTADRIDYDPYASSRFTIPIGAITDTDVAASYTEPGSAALVVAHSSGGTRGVVTTSGSTTATYTSSFGGTSSASPLAAGVLALVMQANPNLSLRDVQHLLVRNARKNSPADSGWSINAAGRSIHYRFGYGAVDAGTLVPAAQSFTPVAPLVTLDSGLLNVGATLPDANTTGLTRTFTLPENIRLEHVEVVLNISTLRVGDLRVTLTSPGGTPSVLAVPRSDGTDNYADYVFTTRRLWDEESSGVWTIRIADETASNIATWNSWRLRFFGTAITPTCPADIANTDGNPGSDGTIDNGDFTLFFAAFFAGDGDPIRTFADLGNTDAEVGPDGLVDNGDFTLFFTSFFSPC
ncbi:MAG: S8 family serine peptidase [Phycisphaerales bacterium]